MHDNNREVYWTEDNTAHNFTDILKRCYWKNAPKDLEQDNHFIHRDIIYEYLHLDSGTVFPTHAYPNFELVFNRIPDAKIIIIGFTKDDIKEIVLNGLIKNKPTEPHNETLFFLRRRNYHDLIVPEVYKKNVQIIMYNELFEPVNNSFVALEKISSFLNYNINEVILKNYKLYVDGRAEFLKKHAG